MQNERGKKPYLPGVGSGFSAAATTICFPSGHLSSSSLARSNTIRVRIFWKVTFKYPHHVDLDCPCRDTWPTSSHWLALIWRINLDRTIILNLVIRSRLKIKRIWVIRTRDRRSGPLNPFVHWSLTWLSMWTRVRVTATRCTMTSYIVDVAVYVAKFMLFLLLLHFFKFLFK